MAHSFPKKLLIEFSKYKLLHDKAEKSKHSGVVFPWWRALEVSVTSSSTQQETEAEPRMASTYR